MIKYISEKEVDEFISKQENVHETHKTFREWKKHILLISQFWPHCKKFYKGDGKFLGYYGEKLEAIYWYNKIDDEIYDGFLMSSKPGAGLKLARYLENEVDWKENWSLCEKKYLKYNERLGYKAMAVELKNDEEWILLWRQKKY